MTTQPILMTGDQIATLIVKYVRRHEHCTDFKSVSVYKISDGQIPGTNWSCGVANYGGSDERACNDVLREVVPRIMYEKAGFARMAEFEGWHDGHVNVVLCKRLAP
jgi:hypothetical protein